VKLSVAREALLDRLQTLVRVASTHSAVQALSGVQFEATDAAVELRATDLEVGLRMPLDGSVARPGTVVLPARLLLDVVRALPAGEVELELRTAEQDVELRCGAATFDIRTLRAEDFPALPTAQAESAVTVRPSC
jgi:DNA polymerase-3 subunit beta